MTNISKNKTITVIVAAYKAQAYINQALDSVLSQELPDGWNLQLILGIDCCYTTRNAISSLNDTRLSVYMMRENQGTYVTFNTMMKYAEGDIITRFDADDIMYKNFLSSTIEKMEMGYSLIRYGIDLIDENGTKIGSYDKGLAHGLVTFSRRLWDLVGGYQPWRCGADSEFVNKAEHILRAQPGKRSYHFNDKSYIGYRSFANSNSLTRAVSTTFGSFKREEARNQITKNLKFWKTRENLKFKTVPLGARCIKIK